MWLRVFAPTAMEVPPAMLADCLKAVGIAVVPHFKGDDLGWTSGEMYLQQGGTPLLLARYLTQEDDLRDVLNAHAAELETMTYSPNAIPLMERVIQAAQLVTIRKPVDYRDESELQLACDTLAQSLANATGGVYQVDGRGWFEADGERLVEEF